MVPTSSCARQSTKIQVLTPSISLTDNQYLSCLWRAVEEHNIEVVPFKTQAIWKNFAAKSSSGKVVHFHWIQRSCPLINEKSVRSLLLTCKNILGLLLLRIFGYQLVWTIHNTLSHDTRSPRLEYGLRWLFSRLCTDIVVMSHYSQQEFARMYGRSDRVHVIPHGHYIGVYANQIRREEARKKLKISDEKKVFLHLGQIKKYKGTQELISAFTDITDPNALLVIAGSCRESDLLNDLQHAAQKDPRIVLQIEFIPDRDIQIYMNACDWVVLPYQKILNSGSTLLAFSFSRPVIVPAQGSLTELVVDGKHGFCYGNGDLKSMLDRALATSTATWEKMCDQSFELANQFDWSTISYQLSQVYRSHEQH